MPETLKKYWKYLYLISPFPCGLFGLFPFRNYMPTLLESYFLITAISLGVTRNILKNLYLSNKPLTILWIYKEKTISKFAYIKKSPYIYQKNNKRLFPLFLSFFMSFLLLNTHIYAQQNLVPNPSFEQHDSCPNTGGQVQFCNGWSKFSATNTTPDYYNACSLPNEVGVPQSLLLYQPAHSGGAYVGLGTWASTGNNDREDIGAQLSQPLVVGQKYYISFYTVMGGTSDGTYYFDTPSNNIGILLSTVPYSPSHPVSIDNFAHLHTVNIISDTSNWIRIFGSIIADSAYDYVILGNFFDDAHTDTMTSNCGSCVNSYSYYLIDDVCISTDSNTCFVDTSNFTISKQDSDYNIENFNTNVITPNGDGINDYLDFSVYNLKQLTFNVFNRWGTKVFSSSNPKLKWNGKTNNGKKLSDGVYYYVFNATTKANKQVTKHNYITIFNH